MTNMAFTGVIAGTIAVAAAAAAFGYTSIMEPGSTGSASPRSAPSAEARMIRYDTDKDGRISRPELDGALAQEFRGVDTNADGRLDAAEIQRHVEARRADRNTRLEAWRAKAKAQGLDPRKPPFDLSERDNIDTLRYGDWNMDGRHHSGRIRRTGPLAVHARRSKWRWHHYAGRTAPPPEQSWSELCVTFPPTITLRLDARETPAGIPFWQERSASRHLAMDMSCASC